VGSIIDTPLSPHMAGRTMRLIAREFFSPSIRRVEHRGVKRGNKIQVLFPGTNTATANKREPICALPALIKSATSNKREPIVALPALIKSATSNKSEPIVALLLESVSVCCVVVLFPRAKVPPPTWNRPGHPEQARIEPILAELALSRFTT